MKKEQKDTSGDSNQHSKKIQTLLSQLADECLVHDGEPQPYGDDDLVNASLIFNHVLLAMSFRIFRPLKEMPEMIELAMDVGQKMKELIITATGKDMHAVVAAQRAIDNLDIN